MKFRPRSAWRTPWQADTLTGLLMVMCARRLGEGALLDKLIEPMRGGRPPFVLSDAFPGDLLPMPAWCRLELPAGVEPKIWKRKRWVGKELFTALRRGEWALPGDGGRAELQAGTQAKSDDEVFVESARYHNTISRMTDTTTDEGDDTAVGLYQKSDCQLRPEAVQELSVYARVVDASAAELLVELMDELVRTGFGADVSTGRGRLEWSGEVQRASELESPVPGANGVVCLSTFQPKRGPLPWGYWEAFTKFGKAGPELGLQDVRKRPLVMFRPGAVFRTDPTTAFLGHLLEATAIYPEATAAELAERGLQPVHAAFGLAVAAVLPETGGYEAASAAW
ncbi:MAG: type III-A CRISPR-associated RAMP protein Csm4 [Tepidisphaerales bacterium]